MWNAQEVVLANLPEKLAKPEIAVQLCQTLKTNLFFTPTETASLDTRCHPKTYIQQSIRHSPRMTEKRIWIRVAATQRLLDIGALPQRNVTRDDLGDSCMRYQGLDSRLETARRERSFGPQISAASGGSHVFQLGTTKVPSGQSP